MTGLQSLNLVHNQLTSLPESLGQLTGLQGLDLSRQPADHPAGVPGSVDRPARPCLSDNQLTTLPESLGQLTGLQSLHLSGNQLTTLPESLGQLTGLQNLYLAATS